MVHTAIIGKMSKHWYHFNLCLVLACTLVAVNHQSTQAQDAVIVKTGAMKTGAIKVTSGLTLERFDRSVRPQDDFYRFVNGHWLDTFVLPPEKSRYGVFNDLNERARDQLKVIITDLSQKSDNQEQNKGQIISAETQKVSDAYRAFMNIKYLDSLGLKPLEQELEKIRAITSHEQLSSYLGYMWQIGSSGPMRGWIDQDAKNPTEYVLYLMQGGLGLPDRDYYLKDDARFTEIRSKYQSYLGQSFLRMKQAQNQKEADLLALSVIDLESKLAEIQWTRAESRQRDKTYNPSSLEELKKDFKFSWNSFFTGMAPQQNQKIKGVILRQNSFFTKFDTLFQKTSVKTWRSYLRIKLIDQFAPFLSQDWVQHRFNFYGKVVSGTEKNEPRWKRGIAHVEAIMGEALGKIYVAKHFKPEAKARMEKLVENLLIAFRAGIKSLDWMSAETKVQALKKLDHFTVKIGYPNRWKDYSKLHIKADDLIGNVIRSSQFVMKRELNKLGKPIDREEWFMPPQMVNAYYNPSLNEIVFPAAILQPPFFNMEADDAVNYGGIGAVIGHEISHGFDDQGRKSDGEGRLTDWWTKGDAELFQARAQKLSEHYESYQPIEDMKINGALTLGENIGDLGGLTIAYRAYQLTLLGNKSKKMDDFTGEQRFFLSWAQVWACKYREAELRRRLLTDPHSPAMYRVTGIIRQMPEFYKAFNLTPNDKHYLAPEKRVKIW